MPEAAAPAQAPPSTPAAPPPTEHSQKPASTKSHAPVLPGVINDLPDLEDRPRRIAPIRDDRPAIERLVDRQNAEIPAEAKAKTPSQDAETPLETEEAPANEKFAFGGVEFESREAAEQNFRSLRGSFKGLETRAKKAAEERNTAATSAQQWKARAEALEARLNGGGTAAAPVAPSPKTQPPQSPDANAAAQQPNAAEVADAFEKSVDWDFYAELHESKGPQYAQYWLAREMGSFVKKLLSQTVSEATRPMQEQQQALQTLHAAAGLFTRCASLEDPSTGESYYPELRDNEAAAAIARMWVEMGFKPDDPNPERGVHFAILNYRDWQRRSSSAGAASPPTPPRSSSASTVVERLQAAQDAGAAVLTGGAPPRPATPGATEEQRIKKAIREAATYHAGLGFTP